MSIEKKKLYDIDEWKLLHKLCANISCSMYRVPYYINTTDHDQMANTYDNN